MAPFLPWRGDDAAMRAAAWVARCLGRGETAPLRVGDVESLARYLQPRWLRPGEVLFAAGKPPESA